MIMSANAFFSRTVFFLVLDIALLLRYHLWHFSILCFQSKFTLIVDELLKCCWCGEPSRAPSHFPAKRFQSQQDLPWPSLVGFSMEPRWLSRIEVCNFLCWTRRPERRFPDTYVHTFMIHLVYLIQMTRGSNVRRPVPPDPEMDFEIPNVEPASVPLPLSSPFLLQSSSCKRLIEAKTLHCTQYSSDRTESDPNSY